MPKESARSGTPTKNLMAATILPSTVDSKEVLRCQCGLVQFRPLTNNCRRCHRSLDEEPPAPALAPVPSPPVPEAGGRGPLALAIRFTRLRNGLSQRQLAGRLCTARTYISKLETGVVSPTLSSLERVAQALEVSVVELLDSTERTPKDEAVIELVKDELVVALLPYVPRLTLQQMAAVLARIREITSRNSRTRAAAFALT
jgi:transcriptional regulator with XRE-family HTH domain